jgi:hypothetical protein
VGARGKKKTYAEDTEFAEKRKTGVKRRVVAIERKSV